jgi:UDP:flavonoid glycosyltransferase YjiC (YdhE family)
VDFMRVLLAAPSAPARLANMVPLAWALRTAGHDVKIAGQSAFVDRILGTGCVAVDLEDGDETSLAASAELTRFARLWRPDAVVSDAKAQAGTTAARAVGAVAVGLRGALDGDPRSGTEPGTERVYDTVPPSLREHPADGVRPVRHVPYFGAVEVPSWLRRAPRRRRVLLSLRDTTRFGRTCAELARVTADPAVEVVFAAGAVALPDVSLPANVRLVDVAPPVALLPGCVAVVHDGDAELALAAAAHGLPQLALTEPAPGPTGWPADGAALVARIVAVGAGLAGSADRVAELVTDGSLAAAAAALRGEIAALPAPREVVHEIAESIVGPPRSR